jgi:TolA-binding protein
MLPPTRAKLLRLSWILPALVLPLSAQRGTSGDDAYRYLAGLVEKGLFDLAVTEGTTFLREHPDHPQAAMARYRLATALFELDRRREAEPHFQALARADGFEYRIECAFRYGQCALERDDHAAAGAAFARVLASDQTYLHEAARFHQGDALFRGGKHAEAEQAFTKLLESAPGSEYASRARASLVWCAWQRKDAAETERRARDYLTRHAQEPGADEMRVVLGESLLEGPDPRRALEAFRSVTSSEFDDAKRRGIAFALSRAGDHAGAAREFQDLVRAHPESRYAAEARLEAGVETLLAGDGAAALPLLAEVARGGDGEALYWLGRAQSSQGQREQALASFERGLKGAEGDLRERLQVARGDALRALGRAEDAIRAYEGSGSDYALYAAAVTALGEERQDDAIRLATTLVEQYPESKHRLDAELLAAEARFGKRDLEGAERAFRAVLERDPPAASAAQAKNRLAWCRYLAGDHAGASQAFERLVADHPREDCAEEAWCPWARSELERGEAGRAREILERYLRENPAGRFGDQALSLLARAQPGAAGIPALERLVAGFPASPLASDARLDLADRLSAAGKTDQAAGHYRALLVPDAPAARAAEARYGLAWCELQRERYDACGELARAVVDDRSAKEELRGAAAELAIWAAARAGDAEGACAAWRAALAFRVPDEKRLEAARAAVEACRKARRFGEAQAVLDECLKSVRDPDVARAVLVEGAYLAIEEGDLDRAEAQVEVALRRDPNAQDVAEACFFVGQARAKAGDEGGRSLALYRRAASVENPRRAEALYRLGFAELEAGTVDAAAGAFEELARDTESEFFGEALFLLGEARFRQERYADCVVALERLRREVPRHATATKALFRLGLALGKLGRWGECEAALAELARAAPDFPNLAEAELWRGRALVAQEKGRSARAALERVVALDQGELAAQARLALAGLLESEGKVEEALSEYLKVSLLYAHEESVAEALLSAGRCLEHLGRTEQAAARWRELVEQHASSRFAADARVRLAALRSGDGESSTNGTNGRGKPR